MTTTETDTELLRRIKWFMALRLMLISLLLGISPFVLGQGSTPFFLVIGLLYCATVAYSVLLKTSVPLRVQAYGQFFFDIAIISMLLSFTGGIDSNFVLLYVLAIVFASIIIGGQAGMVIAGSCCVFYSAIGLVECFSLLPPNLDTALSLSCDPLYAIYLVLVRSIIFCTLGYFVDYLVNALHSNRLELDELKKLNERILSQIKSGLITTDAAGRIIFVNSAAEEILGYPGAEMIGRSWHAFLGRPVADIDDRWLVDEARSFTRCEIKAPRRDGTEVPVGFTVSSLVDRGGRALGLLILFRDLTQIFRMEERMRRAERLSAAGTILAGVAHEVRTPLTAIRGAVEVLRESGALAGGSSTMADVILKESDRLNRIISDFLASGGPREDAREVADLDGVLDEVILVERQTRGDGARIEKIAAAGGMRARVDVSQIKQVFLNLLDNALDAAGPGGRVTVALEPSLFPVGGKEMALVKVANSGPGVPAEVMAHLFEPFYSTKRQGSGMGLFLSERIVRKHGGMVEVESREGETVFTVSLPVCEKEHAGSSHGG